jgi:uncharacterized protein (DUF39 family)
MSIKKLLRVGILLIFKSKVWETMTILSTDMNGGYIGGTMIRGNRVSLRETSSTLYRSATVKSETRMKVRCKRELCGMRIAFAKDNATSSTWDMPISSTISILGMTMRLKITIKSSN